MIKPKVVVTRRWPAAVEAALAESFDATFNRADRALTAIERKDAVVGADAVLPTVTDRIDARVLESGRPRTRILANFGVGFSHIDIEAARERSITVADTLKRAA